MLRHHEVRELLLNVFKHAQTPRAKVSLRQEAHLFQIDVEDEGVGFDPSDIGSSSGPGGFGLFSVREQIGRLGGNMEVTSALCQGTRVSIRVPLGRTADGASRARV